MDGHPLVQMINREIVIFALSAESGTWYFSPTFSIIHNFCSRLLIQVEQPVNKTLINCYKNPVQISFKLLSITISFRYKGCKVFIGTSGITQSLELVIIKI